MDTPKWIDQLFNSPIYEKEYADATSDSERAVSESEFIIKELGLKESDRVLDLACGPGRHAILIAPEVNGITGSDISQRLIEKASSTAEEKKVQSINFVVEDMREIEYENEFDGAYNYFTAWGYFSDEENFDVLTRVRRALKDGGSFLLEMINRDALMRRFQPQNWKLCTDKTIVLAEHSFDSETGRITSTRTYVNEDEKTTIEIVHHLPSSDELVRMFRRAGFTECRLVSAPDGGKAGFDSFRIAVIGAK